MQTHKVIRFIRFDEYDAQEKLHLFSYKDKLNLIKKGEKVGLFQIKEDNT